MPKDDRAKLKADPEDGTTPISNLLLEALAMAHLSGEEKGAVLFLWRRTYGWEDGEDRRHTDDIISLPEFAAALNTNPQYAARLMNGLVSKGILLRTDLGKGKGYLYTTNTRVNEWDKSCLNGLELSKRYSEGLSKRYRVPSTKKITPPDTILRSPKESIKKDLNKTTTTTTTLSPNCDPEILGLLHELPAWNVSDNDASWLCDFMTEYPTFTARHVRECRDRWDGKNPAKDRGDWKNRLRNWMKVEEKHDGDRRPATARRDPGRSDRREFTDYSNKPLR